MSGHAQTTADMRHIVSASMAAGYIPETAAWFDRWLAQVKAEAWDEGYDKGLSDGQRDDGYVTANPYRADRLAAGETL